MLQTGTCSYEFANLFKQTFTASRIKHNVTLNLEQDLNNKEKHSHVQANVEGF